MQVPVETDGFRSTAVSVVVFLAFAGGGFAADEDLTLRVRPTAELPLRSEAPVAIEVDLEWNSEKLLEGHLEFDIVDRINLADAGRLVATWRGPELALSFGTRHFPMTLPPILVTESQDLVLFNARFVTSDTAIDLGEHEVRVPGRQRTFMIASVSDPARRNVRDGYALAAAMRLEQFLYDPPDEWDRQNMRQGSMKTSHRFVDPEMAPQHVSSWCGFDIVALLDGGLQALRTQQLDTLFRWVRAGGSLYLRPDSQMHDSAQIEFLNRLMAASRSGGTLFATDNAGALTGFPDVDVDGLILRDVGLGRVVIELPADKPDFQSVAWRRVMCFLWKVRASEAEWITARNRWNYQAPIRIDEPIGHAFQPRRINSLSSRLRSVLMPKKVKKMPSWHVIGLLTSLLLVIGPLDYYLLGWLRKRILTWILFPTACIAFTVYTMAAARATVGNLDYQTNLTVLDTADDGAIVRSSRFELFFTAAERDASADLRDTIFRPLIGNVSFANTGRGNQNVLDREIREASRVSGQAQTYQLSGQLPGAYSVTRSFRKWSPRLTRYTRFSGSSDVPDFVWPKLEFEGLLTDDACAAYREQIHESYPEAVVTFSRPSGSPNPGARLEWEPDNPDPEDRLRQAAAIVRDFSSRPPEGLFGVVSRIAPNGNGDFEDLNLTDASHAWQRVFIVTVQQGENFFAYRRLVGETRF